MGKTSTLRSLIFAKGTLEMNGYTKGPPLYLLLSYCRNCMDQNTLDWIWIATGALILLYVAICLLSQKVWINKTLSWGRKEDYPKTFQMNIIGGILSGLFLLACPFLW